MALVSGASFRIPLAMIYAYGMSLFVGMFKTTYTAEDKREISKILASRIGGPLAILLMGWIGTFFM